MPRSGAREFGDWSRSAAAAQTVADRGGRRGAPAGGDHGDDTRESASSAAGRAAPAPGADRTLAGRPARATDAAQAAGAADAAGVAGRRASAGGWGAGRPGETAAPPPPSGAYTVSWDRFDAEIALRDDGTYTVTETQTRRYRGVAGHGWRNIPVVGAVDVSDLTVAELVDGREVPFASGRDRAGTLTARRNGQEARLDWWFEPTTGGESVRTFRVRYAVRGGLASYSNLTELHWKAVHADRAAPGDVGASTITVQLPGPVGSGEVRSAIYRYRPGSRAGSLPAAGTGWLVDGSTLRFEGGRLPPGEGLEVRVTFPPRLASATPAPWQPAAAPADLRSGAGAGTGGAPGDLLLLGAGILGVAAFVKGHRLTRGVDGRVSPTEGRPPDGAVAGPVEPPLALPPALAGALLRGDAGADGLLATLFDLAERGVLRLRGGASGAGVSGGPGSQRQVGVRLLAPLDPPAGGPPLRPHERALLEAIFGREPTPGTEAVLGPPKVSGAFARWVEQVHSPASPAVRLRPAVGELSRQVRRELVEAGLWHAGRPRAAWQGLAAQCGGGALVAWACAQRGLDGLVVVVLLVTAAVGVADASAPRPTPEGQWEAARWRAFREHLRGGEERGCGGTPRAAAGPPVTGRFLAYATAFGCGASWLAGMAAGGHRPQVVRGATAYGGAGAGGGIRPGGSAEREEPPGGAVRRPDRGAGAGRRRRRRGAAGAAGRRRRAEAAEAAGGGGGG